jgi:hypothetical protein
MSIIDLNERGLRHFSTRAAAFRFERSVARGLAEDARYRKQRLQCDLGELVDTFGGLLHAGVAKDAVAEALAVMIDAGSDADHACNRDIDAAGEHFDPIDLTEARALLDALRGKA